MEFSINLIFGLLLLLFSWKYAFGKGMVVTNIFNNRQKYRCNNTLSFMLFSVMTAMVYLGPLSLLKYVLWMVIIVLMNRRWIQKWDGALTMYVIFILWNLYTLTYSHNVSQGWMMILKFIIPIFYFRMGYNAVKTEMDLWIFMKQVVVYCVIYSFLIGGLSEKFWPRIYSFLNFTTGGLFIAYASLADFFAILIAIPVVMYIFTKDKKYLYAIGLLLLSSILAVVRTGIGASIIGLIVVCVVYKRIKSIPAVVMFLLLFVAIVFLIPDVHDKMFIEDDEIVTLNNANSAEIQTNSRQDTWQQLKEKYYYPNPALGSGCGSALGWLKAKYMQNEGAGLVHSDWIQIMCESGNIGLGLYIIFAVTLLSQVIKMIREYGTNKLINLFGALTLASFAACFFCMGFDNVITYAQQAYVLPFMLYGIFLKLIDIKCDTK